MTFAMQVRLWFRQASATERRIAVLAVSGLLVVALLSVMITPSGGGGATLLAGGPGAPLVTAPGGSVVGPDGTPQAPGGQASVGGSSVPGAPTGAGGSSAPGAPGAPGQPAGAGAPGGPGSTPPPSTANSVALTASDRGITEETVKIGFLPAEVGGLGGAGFALNVRTDAAQYAKALGDYVNAHGGVIGRKVEVVTRKTDPLNQSDQAAACESMASDHKVFGVVDTGAIADTPYMDCIAVQNELPYIHNTIWGTEWLARSKGLEVGYPAAIDRVSQTWVRDLKVIDWLPQGGVVGVIGDRCAATDPLIDNVLVPLIKQAGAAKVVVGKHDCDAAAVVGQPGSFAARFKLERVTHVFLAANFASNTVFMSAAQNQGYRPQYTGSDWWQVSSDASAANYPAAQYDGAIIVTSNGMLLEQSGKPTNAGYERCNQVAVDAGLPPLQWKASDQELFAFCDNFFLMMDGLTAAGPNPTRWDWAAGIQSLGDRVSAIFGPSRFDRDKVTGSDTVFTAQWRRDCKCYMAVSDPRAAAA